jgi:hypothetical protein
MTMLIGVLAAAASVAAVVVARTRLRLRGTHVVTCPETNAPAAVDLDLRDAAVRALVGRPPRRLRACSRGAARTSCGQTCLGQLAEAPEDYEVRRILARSYMGRRCAYCRVPFADLRWQAHDPALLALDGSLCEWKDLPPEAAPLALATHWPICWNCLTAQRLRRQRPDLFELRPPDTAARPASL